MNGLAGLKARARRLKEQTLTVYFAARDPRTPLPVRLLALLVAAYALSPIDLIPDFVPVFGYLDDLILIPLGLSLVIRFTPPEVLDSARERARIAAARPVSYIAALGIIAVWVALLVVVWLAVRSLLSSE